MKVCKLLQQGKKGVETDTKSSTKQEPNPRAMETPAPVKLELSNLVFSVVNKRITEIQQSDMNDDEKAEARTHLLSTVNETFQRVSTLVGNVHAEVHVTTPKREDNVFEEVVAQAMDAERDGHFEKLHKAHEKLRALISKEVKLGADTFSVNKAGAFSVTPLHSASGGGCEKTLKLLLTHEAETTKPDINALNCFNQTPMMRLVKYSGWTDRGKKCAAHLVDFMKETGVSDATIPFDVATLAEMKDKGEDVVIAINRALTSKRSAEDDGDKDNKKPKIAVSMTVVSGDSA